MTATTEDVLTDADVDAFVAELTDAPDVPCAYRKVASVECQMAARWATACPTCGHEVRVCTQHMLHIDHAQHRGLVVLCAGRIGVECSTVLANPIPWRVL